MATPQRTVRIEDEIWEPASARAQAAGTTLADVMRSAVVRYLAGELTSQEAPASQQPAPLTVTHDRPAGGIPSPGVACAWPACWDRDTARYGVTDARELARTGYAFTVPRDAESSGIALCAAHAAKLGGLAYRRPAHAGKPVRAQ